MDASPRYRLHFQGPASWDELRRAAGRVLRALGLPKANWKRVEHNELPSGGYGDAFRAVWTRPGARIEEQATLGSGNPRDGYGYDNSWRLTAGSTAGSATAELVIELSDSSWQARPEQLSFSVRASPATLETVRAALRGALGVRRDRSAEASAAATNVRAALERDPERAGSWLDEALRLRGARGGGARRDAGWHQLLTAQEELEGPSEGNLRRRLRDTPEDVAAWRQAMASPPRGWTQQQLETVVGRLAPWEPESLAPPWTRTPPAAGTTWLRLDDGLGATTAGRARLDVPLLRALAPELLQTPTLSFDSVRRGNRIASSWVQAMWPGRSRRGEILARVVREAHTYGPGWSQRSHYKRISARPKHTLEHCWLWPSTDDGCVQIVSEVSRPRAGCSVQHGQAIGLSGPQAFRERVLDVLATFCPFRWEEADPQSLFPEREPRQLVVGDDEKPTAAKLRRVLKRLDVATPELLALLRRCRCKPASGYCKHGRLLIDAQRRWEERAFAAATTPREQFLARARSHALRAALAYKKSGKVTPRALLLAARYLANAEACI